MEGVFSAEKIKPEQVSLVLGPNFLISFQESEGDVFDPIRERISGGKGQIRNTGADYLAYALIDALVDNYFLILENLGEEIEDLEEEVIENPTSKTLERIRNLKKELLVLRKTFWPLREVISKLSREESPLIRKKYPEVPKRRLRSYNSNRRYLGNLSGNAFQNT